MLEKKIKVYSQIINKIKLSYNIALISHRNPDLDTIGSACAFYEMIRNNFLGKRCSLICRDSIPEKYNFLPNVSMYKTQFNLSNYDLIIFFDARSIDQTGFDITYPKLYDKVSFNTINIDHHTGNQLFGKQNILNNTFTSTTMILYEMFKLLKLKINDKSATCLLAGIYTDSGSFQHGNTTNLTFYIAGDLIKLGADNRSIIEKVYKSNTLNTIKLWGKIFKDSFINNSIVYGYINKTFLDSYDCSYDDIGGAINYLSGINFTSYSVILTEKGEYIKGSLRTLRDDIDLTKIAGIYGGGGHKKASGFTTKGKISFAQGLEISQID